MIAKINADVNEALKDGEIRKRFEGLSAEIVGGTPQATAAYMKEEVARWNTIIKSAGVKLE